MEEEAVLAALSNNCCYYNENYDNLEGATDWAQKTLNDHRKDKREHLFNRKKLEEGKNHDDLWNAF